MHCSSQHPVIIKYGIAHAEDLYTLSELVNAQISKGYQPAANSSIQYMPFGELMIYLQVMVKYQQPAVKKKIIVKPKTSK